MNPSTILKTVMPALLALLVAFQPASAAFPLPARPDGIQPIIQTQGTARVVVALRLPATARSVGERQVQVAQAQSRVIQALAASDEFQVTQRFQTVPGLVGLATTQGLEDLRRNPEVAAVALDIPVYADLAESTALIRAARVWNELGLTGAGVNIAVIDTGIDRAHPDLADHIVAQHCFNQGSCPPGNTNEGDSAQDEHGHGTHVAGIITGKGTVSPRGVAPDAGIVAVRVMDKNAAGWNSDVVAAIDWVVANQARLNVRAINLSLGAGRYAEACDNADANTLIEAAALNAARQAGIITFAASGNEGAMNGMVLPACVAGVVAVGATYDANLGSVTWPPCSDASATTDMVACFSNSSSGLDVLAPGATIMSTALGGGQTIKSGTSMASPHAAAVAALMLQAYPSLQPAETESVLKKTGVAVTDKRNGRVTPRIDALAAVTRVLSDHVTVSTSFVPASLPANMGEVATTTLQVEGTRELYSADFRIKFDPSLVKVMDADPATPGVQIAVGSLWRGRAVSVTKNQADNASGVIEFAAGLRAPAQPITVSGAAALITWQGKSAGISSLTWPRSWLARSNSSAIPHNAKEGAVRIQPGAISGGVVLQGRTHHTDTLIYLTPSVCAPPVSLSQVLTPTGPATQTDVQGQFTLTALPGSSYACLQVVRANYLIGQKSTPSGALGTLTLPGGDVNGDDIINIFDLARVGAQYGSDDPVTDVNGDGAVNIFDLALVAGNLGRAGPVSDWR